jgi:O-methyltransferase involved in polyketide biosynthesis
VRFVPLDLERSSLRELLVGAGLDISQSALFGWLGVLNYLTPASVAQTLRTVATEFAKGSEIVFDYSSPPNMQDEQTRTMQGYWIRGAERGGEPVRSFIIPARLKPMLFGFGFSEVEQIDGEAINGRYFFGRRDGLRVSRAMYYVRALV